eukprot:365167-Chlamydomonas_euryale.AAC.5
MQTKTGNSGNRTRDLSEVLRRRAGDGTPMGADGFRVASAGGARQGPCPGPPPRGLGPTQAGVR